ncbi:MAG TPA: hypothetical protein VFY84_09060 [Jiangellales bacterium]|nr:hypothetical protein [Jiangellales bacterium]
MKLREVDVFPLPLTADAELRPLEFEPIAAGFQVPVFGERTPMPRGARSAAFLLG